jgi:hypothetical protein
MLRFSSLWFPRFDWPASTSFVGVRHRLSDQIHVRSVERSGRSSSGRVRGRSPSRAAGSREEVEPIDRGAESECSTTSTHPSALGQPYTPSLPDDSSASDPDPDANLDSLRKDSTDELCLKDAGAVAVALTFTNWRLRSQVYIADAVDEDK